MKNNSTVELLVATSSKGKIKEIQSFLSSLPTRTLHDFLNITEVVETGSTFTENAVLKARGYATQTSMWTLADDSGLEVDALSGEPGVHSARYGGLGLSDADRVKLLLHTLSRITGSARRARFVSVIAIADPSGEVVSISTGECTGRIASSPKGTNGFGYDPVFVPDGYEQTFGELSSEIKDKISHRAKALVGARTFLIKRFRKK